MNSSIPGKLMVVDDEAAQLDALRVTLENEGYMVATFASARHALDRLRDESFDLLLTDLTMPDMDGLSLLKAAQRVDPNLVGLVMTGHGSIESAVAAMKTGALDYITKPFTLRTMRPALERALTVRRLMTENLELRRSKDAVCRLNIELERQIEERTEQLTEANRELEAFSQSVSHDLRAPLRAINGFGKVLLDDFGEQLDGAARGYIEKILAAGARMEQLIFDLMRLSHASAVELHSTEVDLSSLASAAIAELREREPERKIDVRVAPGMTCRGDPQLLRIALDNLIGNAWKFTRDVPDARIEIAPITGAPDGFLVRDNGIGFDAAHAKNLFAPFRRLHSANQFPGTGVGLSIVQRIIRRHGGRISAQSAPGYGATFSFTVPDPKTVAHPFGASS